MRQGEVGRSQPQRRRGTKGDERRRVRMGPALAERQSWLEEASVPPKAERSFSVRLSLKHTQVWGSAGGQARYKFG